MERQAELPSAEKTLDRMDRLADMGHFPVAVHAGATANVLLTLLVTWKLERWCVHGLQTFFTTELQPLAEDGWQFTGVLNRFGFWMQATPLVWVLLVLAVNLTPVVLLRLSLRPDTVYPTLRTMRFWSDQHKFASWVYLAASANMAFWVLLGWTAIAWNAGLGMRAGVLCVAAVATFSPVLLRFARGDLQRER